MPLTLTEFKNNVADVARPNRFLMTIPGVPAGINVPQNLQYLVKSALVPSRTIGEVMLNWQGMQHKLAGDPTYDDYTVTILNDSSFTARKFFEDWINIIANTESNERSAPSDYFGELQFQHLGRKESEILATYRMINAYPKQLDQIDTAYDSNDTPEEFSVTFSVDYWIKS